MRKTTFTALAASSLLGAVPGFAAASVVGFLEAASSFKPAMRVCCPFHAFARDAHGRLHRDRR